jgi:hypothetical protein
MRGHVLLVILIHRNHEAEVIGEVAVVVITTTTSKSQNLSQIITMINPLPTHGTFNSQMATLAFRIMVEIVLIPIGVEKIPILKCFPGINRISTPILEIGVEVSSKTIIPHRILRIRIGVEINKAIIFKIRNKTLILVDRSRNPGIHSQISQIEVVDRIGVVVVDIEVDIREIIPRPIPGVKINNKINGIQVGIS